MNLSKDPYIHMYYSKEFREREKRDPVIPIIHLSHTTETSFAVSLIETRFVDMEVEIIRDCSLSISIGPKNSFPFICGFVDHKHEDLQRWRALTNYPPTKMTMTKRMKILKTFAYAFWHTMKEKTRDILENYQIYKFYEDR